MRNVCFLLLTIFASAFTLTAQWEPIHNFNFHIQAGTLIAKGTDTVIVAADNGWIFFSDDKGQNFIGDSLPFPYSWYHDLHFPSSTTGYVCGGSSFGPVNSPIAKTTDGGKTWDSISGNEFGYELHSVFFTDENTGYIGGEYLMLKTTDGGQTFTVDSMPQYWAITDIVFTNASTGFFIASNEILRTTDAGQNWNIVFTDSSVFFPVYSLKLDFVNTQTGFVLTQNRKLIKTVNGGNSWHSPINQPDTLGLDNFDFVSENVGYGIVNGNGENRIYKTTDGGLSWSLQLKDTTNQYLVEISMADENTGYILGSNNLLRTTNGGINLNERMTDPVLDIYPNPAKGSFNISSEKSDIVAVSLKDASGREIKSWQGRKNDCNYSLASVKDGMYILHIKTRKGVVLSKLVVYE